MFVDSEPRSWWSCSAYQCKETSGGLSSWYLCSCYAATQLRSYAATQRVASLVPAKLPSLVGARGSAAPKSWWWLGNHGSTNPAPLPLVLVGKPRQQQPEGHKPIARAALLPTQASGSWWEPSVGAVAAPATATQGGLTLFFLSFVRRSKL